jgi:hypothetical protein
MADEHWTMNDEHFSKRDPVPPMKPRHVSDVRAIKARKDHPLEWLTESVAAEPTFVFKAWFGGRSIMLRGKHQLFLTTQGEPWQGVLVCTFHEHQASLLAEFPALRKHPVLGKWLYLPETAETFERDAVALVRLAKRGDPRLGVGPSPRKKRVKKIRVRKGKA